MGSLAVVLLVLAGVAGVLILAARRRAGAALKGARVDAEHWYGLLGGQVMNLDAAGDPTVQQALADASERYTAAGSVKSSARTAAAFRAVSEVSLEGLHFIRAARTALGVGPGPDLPTTAAQAAAGRLEGPQSGVTVGGQSYTGQPWATGGHRFFYPGGVVGGRPVPGGWYSRPFWKGALLGGAAAVGGSLLLGGIADVLTGGFGEGGEPGDGWGGRDDSWGDGGDVGSGDR